MRLPAVNGLCEACNRNQEMKVIQLANFKPRVEAKYDEEIEEYRTKIEDSYQLCQQCQRTLNKTLNRIKTKFIGSKISQLVAKGIKVATSPSEPKDRQISCKLAMVSIFLLSVVNLIENSNISLDFLKTISNDSMTNILYHFIALRLTIIDLFTKWMTEMKLDNLVDLNIDVAATSAVIFNFMILFKQRCIQTQIVLSMLFWSLKMVVGEIPINPSYTLALNMLIAGTLVLVSMAMIYKYNKKAPATLEDNTSFHKLHSEVIDDSDNETDVSPESTFNFDVRSCRSSVVYTPSMSTFNGTVREKTLLKPMKTFPCFENSSMFNKSVLSSTFGRQEAPSVATIDLLSNRSFSIRQEVAAADRTQVHKDITKLNISGNLLGSTSTLKDFNIGKNLNPFALENSRCGSPTPSIASVFSGSQRTQIISPPRLDATHMREANTSWVAGGYWSSPQKRFLEVQSNFSQNPELSRSSSQSSGLGTIDSDKNSRENSIGHDDVASSIFSEPVRRRNLFDRPPSDARSLYGQSFVQIPKANSFFLNATNASQHNFRKYRDDNSFFK